jgi:hypothetical protein
LRIASIAREWVHSHEEDTEDTQVFRPADFAFPRQRRPRTSIDLTPGGDASLKDGPAHDDRRSVDSGSWTVDGDELKLQLAGRADVRYRIESADEDKLVLRRLS